MKETGAGKHTEIAAFYIASGAYDLHVCVNIDS
jgi:hypothetical protein